MVLHNVHVLARILLLRHTVTILHNRAVPSRFVPVSLKKRNAPQVVLFTLQKNFAKCRVDDSVIEWMKFISCHTDCSGVNRFAHIEQYPLPTPEDLFATLACGMMFSKLDMVHAYQQILIDDDSKQYLTINTHRGLFVYNRLAFGVSASAIFQRAIGNLLAGVPRTVVYLDDILATGASEEEHQTNMKEVLRRLVEAGLRLKKDKCNFGVVAVEYLGHRIIGVG